MILKTLAVNNYRNIEQADLLLSPKLNCFVGSNGVGKTNLLDAIYYLSFCRSAFSQTNQQVLRHDQEWMA
ncbi:MAG: AAA family ATPase, partial [Bacteroidaceae bacterium]|nr:AAA family ATPase [Bacteroidaceae bacterium]